MAERFVPLLATQVACVKERKNSPWEHQNNVTNRLMLRF
jgi:galactose-1-phosphate uridylyltransferase